MINAQQARENSYDKIISWCEDKLQPEIQLAIIRQKKNAYKLFGDWEVDPEHVKDTLEDLGFKVTITNLTERFNFSSKYGNIYNVTVFW